MKPELIVVFYYKDKVIYDPDWDRRHFVIPNVDDEVFLNNAYENLYEKHWYTVRKRRWLTNNIVRVYLNDDRYQIN